MATNNPQYKQKTMKFAQENLEDGYVITAYEDNRIFINGKAFEQSLIITGTQLNENWGLKNIQQLSSEYIEGILAYKPELILIGTGEKLVFPAAETYSEIIRHGIGVDFMDTHAACRTYNILMSESRDVVAGLIL